MTPRRIVQMKGLGKERRVGSGSGDCSALWERGKAVE